MEVKGEGEVEVAEAMRESSFADEVEVSWTWGEELLSNWASAGRAHGSWSPSGTKRKDISVFLKAGSFGTSFST